AVHGRRVSLVLGSRPTLRTRPKSGPDRRSAVTGPAPPAIADGFRIVLPRISSLGAPRRRPVVDHRPSGRPGTAARTGLHEPWTSAAVGSPDPTCPTTRRGAPVPAAAGRGGGVGSVRGPHLRHRDRGPLRAVLPPSGVPRPAGCGQDGEGSGAPAG